MEAVPRKLGIELGEHLSRRDRPRNVASPQQDCEKAFVSLGVAAVKSDRALQFVERTIIIGEMHKNLPEQGVCCGTEIVQSSSLSRLALGAFESLAGLRRPAFGHRVEIDISQSDISRRIVRIELDRTLEQVARLSI